MVTKAQRLKAEIELIDLALESQTPLPKLLDRVRRDYILRALELHDGDVSATAKTLRMNTEQVSAVQRRANEN